MAFARGSMAFPCCSSTRWKSASAFLVAFDVNTPAAGDPLLVAAPSLAELDLDDGFPVAVVHFGSELAPSFSKAFCDLATGA